VSRPLPQCQFAVQQKCPRSDLRLIETTPIAHLFGCLTCKGVTIITRSEHNRASAEEGERQKFLAATPQQRAMFHAPAKGWRTNA
jgi:hypothetical protein